MNAGKVYDVFTRYENGILPCSHDLMFRARWASQTWFSLVDNSPEKIQVLVDDIDYDRGILTDYLVLMNAPAV